MILCRTAQRLEVQRTHRRWWIRRSSSSIAGFTRSQLAQAQPKGRLAGAWPRMRRAFLLLLLIVQAFVPCGTTMPSADFCRTIRMNYSILSPDSGTYSRSPAISLTAFNAQPPNLQPAPLMDMDFAVTCQLVRRRMPHIRFLSIGSRLFSTLLSDPASRRRPCASLSLLLHQNVKGTYTPKLSNMHGVHAKSPAICRAFYLPQTSTKT